MTQNDVSTKVVPVGNDVTENEIDLVDLLRVIWKWKYVILAGTFCVILIAAVINWNMQNIYRINLQLKPGVQKISTEGKPVYIDTAENIKLLIETEVIPGITKDLQKRNKNRTSAPCIYKLEADKKMQIVTIMCESPEIEEGIDTLNYLTNQVMSTFDSRLEYLKDDYDHRIKMTRRQLDFNLDEEKFIASKIMDIQTRLDKVTQEKEISNNLSDSKSRSQDTLLDYSSIVEKVANLKRKHSDASWQIDYLKKEIETIEEEKRRLVAVQVIQPPTATHYPVAPNKKRNVMMAGFSGLFMMVIFSFLLEFISRTKDKK